MNSKQVALKTQRSSARKAKGGRNGRCIVFLIRIPVQMETKGISSEPFEPINNNLAFTGDDSIPRNSDRALNFILQGFVSSVYGSSL
jgi:hypothetical protein